MERMCSTVITLLVSRSAVPPSAWTASAGLPVRSCFRFTDALSRLGIANRLTNCSNRKEISDLARRYGGLWHGFGICPDGKTSPMLMANLTRNRRTGKAKLARLA